MESFISSFVIILPGLMAYFWLQLFGINPPVKHTTTEMTGIAALLWLPISGFTLLILNALSILLESSICACAIQIPRGWAISDIKIATGDFRYLLLFMGTSAIISFFLCAWWARKGHPWMHNKINEVRIKRGMAPLSTTATVWEEFFIKIEDNEDETKNKGKQMLLQVQKIDKPDCVITGYMAKASRPHEADKALVLGDVEEWKERLEYYDFKIKRVYYDIKNGVLIKELDPNDYKEKEKKDSPSGEEQVRE